MKKAIKIAVTIIASVAVLWGIAFAASKITETRHEPKALIKALPKFTIAGHRGASIEYPPNTLAAFRRLKQIDTAAMLEMDLWETKDGAIVVFHDELLETSTDGKGRIADHTLEDIRSFEAGYNVTFDGGKSYPFRKKGYRIPTFKEVLDEFPDSFMSVEIKYPSNSFADKVMALILRYGMLDRVLMGSFHDNVIDFIRSRYPSVAISFSSSDVKRFLVLNRLCLGGFFRSNSDIMVVPQFSDTDRPEYLGPGVSQGFRVITRQFIDGAHRLGFPVMAWTINKKENMEDLLNLGIDGVITDDPALLKSVLGSRGAQRP